MNDSQWFYYAQGRQVGPVAWETLLEDIRAGRLGPEDYVWTAAMGASWAPARLVPGLFSPPGPAPMASVPTSAAPAPSVRAAPVLVVRAMGVKPEPVLTPSPAPAGPPSLTGPIRPAWERMKALLFRPFRLGFWFVLGFTAWLATLGEQTGSWGGSGGTDDWKGWGGDGEPPNLEMAMEWLTEGWRAYAPLVMGVMAVVVLVGLLVGMAILWVRSRGKFMFLDNVVHNRARVAEPWRAFRPQAWSLFWWSVGYTLVCLLVTVILLAVAWSTVLRPWWFQRSLEGLWPLVVVNGAVWFALAVAAAFIARYLEDFVIPLMYRDRLRATAAWGRFLALFGERAPLLIGYGFFYLLLVLVYVAAIVLLVLVTCCIAGCLMMIPYVGTVILLPALVFFRAYSLEFLSQFGPEYRVTPDTLAGPREG